MLCSSSMLLIFSKVPSDNLLPPTLESGGNIRDLNPCNSHTAKDDKPQIDANPRPVLTGPNAWSDLVRPPTPR